MRIEIPHRLIRLNEYINAERTNKFMGAKLKREMTELVGWHVKGLPKIDYPAWYTFTWYVKNRRSDPDNISFGAKFILDGLVAAGKLPNDNLAYVLAIDHRFVVGTQDKVIVEIVEYEE